MEISHGEAIYRALLDVDIPLVEKVWISNRTQGTYKTEFMTTVEALEG